MHAVLHMFSRLLDPAHNIYTSNLCALFSLDDEKGGPSKLKQRGHQEKRGRKRRRAGRGTLLSAELVRGYNRIAKTLVKYEALWHQQWVKSVGGYPEKLHLPLLIRRSPTSRNYADVSTEDEDGPEKASSPNKERGREKRKKHKTKSVEDSVTDAADVAEFGIQTLVTGIAVNFDARVFELTHEARHLRRLGHSVPPAAIFVCEQEARLKHAHDELKVRCPRTDVISSGVV